MDLRVLEIKLGLLLNTILGKADPDYIDFKISAVFEPEVTCRLLAEALPKNEELPKNEALLKREELPKNEVNLLG